MHKQEDKCNKDNINNNKIVASNASMGRQSFKSSDGNADGAYIYYCPVVRTCTRPVEKDAVTVNNKTQNI